MKKISFLFALVLLFSCQDNTQTQEEERQTLLAMFNEIETLSTSVVCEDASDWSFTTYGHKGCGGPQGFIAYSNQIDVNAFLALVERYTNAERAYNIRWGIISTCDLPATPTGVSCDDGNAVLNY